MTAAPAIAPGATIGMIGGGQLGRMTALAAARLGYRVHVYCPEADSPTAQVCDAATVAAYDDHGALDRFAAAVDVVTLEFENIPHDTVRRLSRHVPVRPGWQALHITQNRLREKDFITGLGIATAPYRPVRDAKDLADALDALGRPAILKSTELGYDGKGQTRIDAATDDLAAAWRAIGSDEGILEGFVTFACEVSVVVARGVDGALAAFDPVENRHRNHILDVTIAPAAIPAALAAEARVIAATLAREMDYVGVLAVEMFVTDDGRLLVNEMAPRPHNSGHWTLDACITDQFEQAVRAVCGLPLGDPSRLADARMQNLLGSDADDWADILADPTAKLHLYGKATARAGRKMGHVTRLTRMVRIDPTGGSRT